MQIPQQELCKERELKLKELVTQKKISMTSTYLHG